MRQEERLQEIKKILTAKHRILTRDIAKTFNISFDTARRDVIHLTVTGQALRVHGGLLEMNRESAPSFLTRNQVDSPVKNKMAQMAKHFIHPGQCDFIGPSTTLKKLCGLLTGTDIEIVTNSLDNSLAMMQASLPNVYLLGGKINKQQRYNYSLAAINTLQQVKFDTAFIGAASIADDGAYSVKMSDAELVKTAVQRAKQVVVIAENYKFDKQTTIPYLSVPLHKIDVVITDYPLAEKWQRQFNSNTQVISVLKKEENYG
ncbi:DeoR/GlpR family DNA-binding transcription regulator [Lactobacillus sp. ESL0791]|uniref:DeoR/GlpR family DNA-binding transcription regulator n=1 Tax=Lactobacillus sp. ESL0791 TaxID=2983234 RepID=UPI0023F84601|nr:DeoR/GlpR family DNA-binding transcription regulator [Lactobacillus sp. ESL0791]MDF7639219.1 DeoR/GlpR family DNA-binding transcription regulator [Lactobacillus sp. ESL0791]